MNATNEIKTVVSFSGNGLVFAVLQTGTGWLVAVRKYGAMNSYKVVDVVSCEDEQDARATAWALSEPDGYEGV